MARTVELDWKGKDGSTKRAHLRQAEKQTGQVLIEETEPPAGAEYLLEWFWDVSKGRGEGFSGPMPLSSGEIKAWAELSGLELDPWEFRVIRTMDRAFLEAVAKTRQ